MGLGSWLWLGSGLGLGLGAKPLSGERQLTAHGAARDDVEEELDLLGDGQHEPVQGEAHTCE